jgi:hypothetical protein
MGKFYKIFDHGKNKAHTVTAIALEMLKKSKQNIQVLGACDEQGNMLADIAENNFISNKTLKKQEQIKTLKEDSKKTIKNKKDLTGEEPEDDSETINSKTYKGIELDEFGDPKGNIDYQPSAKELKEKLKNDAIAKKHYEKNKQKLLKTVSNDPKDKFQKD